MKTLYFLVSQLNLSCNTLGNYSIFFDENPMNRVRTSLVKKIHFQTPRCFIFGIGSYGSVKKPKLFYLIHFPERQHLAPQTIT